MQIGHLQKVPCIRRNTCIIRYSQCKISLSPCACVVLLYKLQTHKRREKDHDVDFFGSEFMTESK